MERTGYILLAIVAIGWFLAIFMQLIALGPLSIFFLLGLAGIAILFAKVVGERINSKEDDYYAKNVEK